MEAKKQDQDMKNLMTILEVLEYQRKKYGRILVGRDALYAIARRRAKHVPHVRIGSRIYYPQSTIDRLISGDLHA